MKLKSFLLSLLLCLSASVQGQWETVGKADYDWGPFHIYTVSLASENGQYQNDQLPLMISFDYAKPVEGKNFAILMIKEMESLGADKKKTDNWLKLLEKTLTEDFAPNDRLNFIALPEMSYFVLNDEVLPNTFDPEFTRNFLNVWLSGKGGFRQLEPLLTGKEKAPSTDSSPKQPEVVPFTEEDASPQLPPNYQFINPHNMLG
ncbi:hypothetical protein RYD26_04905 [Pasteurellaceae bacterium LIM206]|nr:hypothetical protein [Pasteurellaceae bacterium LIM206]